VAASSCSPRAPTRSTPSWRGPKATAARRWRPLTPAC
jgi:hypothetical protein